MLLENSSWNVANYWSGRATPLRSVIAFGAWNYTPFSLVLPFIAWNWQNETLNVTRHIPVLLSSDSALAAAGLCRFNFEGLMSYDTVLSNAKVLFLSNSMLQLVFTISGYYSDHDISISAIFTATSVTNETVVFYGADAAAQCSHNGGIFAHSVLTLANS